MPMRPQTRPCASRIGSLLVSPHTGTFGRLQNSSKRSRMGRPVRSTCASCSVGTRP